MTKKKRRNRLLVPGDYVYISSPATSCSGPLDHIEKVISYSNKKCNWQAETICSSDESIIRIGLVDAVESLEELKEGGSTYEVIDEARVKNFKVFYG